jgi:hypothetical protein
MWHVYHHHHVRWHQEEVTDREMAGCRHYQRDETSSPFVQCVTTWLREIDRRAEPGGTEGCSRVRPRPPARPASTRHRRLCSGLDPVGASRLSSSNQSPAAVCRSRLLAPSSDELAALPLPARRRRCLAWRYGRSRSRSKSRAGQTETAAAAALSCGSVVQDWRDASAGTPSRSEAALSASGTSDSSSASLSHLPALISRLDGGRGGGDRSWCLATSVDDGAGRPAG